MNKLRRKCTRLLSISALIMLTLLLFAQYAAEGQLGNTTISGKITGEGNSPLSGVAVQVKGTTRGTTTNTEGNFSISASASDVLVVSYVGYINQERPVAGKTAINITLVTATQDLNTVVVVGYGTQRRRDVTGSVANVKGADIAKQPVLTATQAIQGKVAGVQVISSGQPNSLPIVRVRGVGTMLAGTNPLYVVDGVITDDIRNINTADITSMDILKDASATAIYGMRAANGVLIITTKKGRVGKLVTAYDGNVGLNQASRVVPLAGAHQYAGYLNEYANYYGNGVNLVDTTLVNNGTTHWLDAIFRTAIQQNHNLSVSGGTDKITYFLSAGYLDQEGIILNNKLQRFTLRSNNEYRINKAIKVSTLISYSRANVNDVNPNVTSEAYRAAPYIPSKVGGKYGNTSAANNVGNPVLDLDKNYNKGVDNRLQGTGVLEIKPLDWLTLRSSIGVDLDFYNNTQYGYAYAADATTFITIGGNQQRTTSSLTVAHNTANRWVWDNTITATKTFGKHNFNLLAGITSEEYRFNSLSGTRLNVPAIKDQWYLDAGNATTSTVSNPGDKWSRNSYLGRLNYAYANKYLLTATFRADGTSRLPSTNRWGNFPSAGIGWVISNEGFMKNQALFNNLKLRGSWGRVGNDNIPTSAYIPVGTINIPYFFNNNLGEGVQFQQLVDKNLKWETTDEYDAGLDFSLLKSKLSGEIDFYDKKTKDALVIVNISTVSGDIDGNYITNAATVQNRGIELGLNWNDAINKDWSYSVGGNIALNQNKVLKLNGGQALPSGGVGSQGFTTLSENGYPIGSFYLLQSEGVIHNQSELAAYTDPKTEKPVTINGQVPQVGDLKYTDSNGDGNVDANDRTHAGSYQPKATYGFSGSINYKSFDLSVNTYGTIGSKIYNANRAIRGGSLDNIEADVAVNRWTTNNPNSNVPRANVNELPHSTYDLQSGDFFRVNNLTIGYALPAGVLSRYKLNNLRIYITSQNLATFTKYTGFTPEILPVDQANNPGVLGAGVDLNTYPTTRTYAIGINLNF